MREYMEYVLDIFLREFTVMLKSKCGDNYFGWFGKWLLVYLSRDPLAKSFPMI